MGTFIGILPGIGATLIPLLALSIPGDAVTAILYGALLIQGIQTGPLIFQQHLDAVYLVYITLTLANICMVVAALSFMPLFRRVSEVPSRVLFPIIFVLCVVGAFAMRNNMFDVYVMMGFGVLGYGMRKCAIPVAPLLISYSAGGSIATNPGRLRGQCDGLFHQTDRMRLPGSNRDFTRVDASQTSRHAWTRHFKLIC